MRSFIMILLKQFILNQRFIYQCLPLIYKGCQEAFQTIIIFQQRQKNYRCAQFYLVSIYLLTQVNKIMGKRSGSSSKNAKPQGYKIAKSKSLQKNFDAYLHNLIKSQPKITYKQCAPLLHKFVNKCIHTLNRYSVHDLAESANKIKVCRTCNNWIHRKQKFLQCFSCEDNYHKKCMDDHERFEASKMCKQCEQVSKASDQKKQEKFSSQQQKECFKCSNVMKTKKMKVRLLKCLKCVRNFHLGCFGSEKGVCQECEQLIKQKLFQIKNQINDAHCISRQMTLSESFKKFKPDKNNHSIYKQEQKIDEDTRTSLFTSRLFKHNYPPLTQAQIEEYKRQLMFAIYAKNMEYVENLQPQNCELSWSPEESLDFGTAELGTSDLKIYQKYKQQPIGPFRVQFKQGMGYDVVADKDLPKGMLVCQYVGDVYSHRDSISLGYNDSRMELRKGINSDDNLFIIPHKFTNLARFINSLKKEDKNRLNMGSVKCYVGGKPVVLLYTIKQIKKGQSLFYDYNAGQAKQGYDTSGYQ